jgi:hypothetical protein
MRDATRRSSLIASRLIPPGLLLCLMASAAAGPLTFREVVIDPAACDKACYAVSWADVDGNGQDDIVVVTEDEVVWYAYPDWSRRVIISGQTELDNVCLAAHDIDGDGQVDFALGAGWTKVGTIQWLSRGASLDEPWHVHAIGVEPWTHRMRWARVLDNGRLQLTVSPLNATEGAGVRLLAYDIPAHPRTDPWPSTVLDDTFNRLHNHWHVDFNEDGVDETITASQEGVFVIRRRQNGEFVRRQVGSGMVAASPEQSGAGEVKLGRLGNGQRFLATIEPMHGTSVVIYRTSPGAGLPKGQLAERTELESSLTQGHAVWTADLDGDPGDEIVIGFREKSPGADVEGPGVLLFDSGDAAGASWARTVIDDGGMACEDLFCRDMTGDGRADIVAAGRTTKNVKLYVNETPPASGQAPPE